MKRLLFLGLLILVSTFVVFAQEKTTVAVEEKESRPISMGVVVDNSMSFRLALDFVVDTTKVVGREIKGGDEVSLVRFVSKEKIELLQELTGDKNVFARSADEMYCEGGLTAISDAVLHAARELSNEGKNERKVLVLITDGEDKSDKQVYADALAFLKEKKIPVFIIGITTVLERNIGESKKFLERLAADTGGSVVFVDRKTSAADAGNAITKAIREQK